ncbi:stage III sporulation protein AG [Ammoniphilus sp. CFH 90114]|uniref:stage III sporulation protein AG n=1 Tax=Ammoniphilus sp. CFH 90114 TaxID=2493665 RepID=UPI00100DF3F5|nr:stage III sporulation protein AG [Ammoniphilus sp. CFH 90114]RXT13781.1 stage III sporulation protein AG [Ammoniphilus sp. CFH 90114]
MSKWEWFSKMKEKWGQREEGQKRVNTFQKLVILGGIGAAIMIFSSLDSVKRESAPSTDPEAATNEQAVFSGKVKSNDLSISDYEEIYENQLKGILEEVIGVGEVSVMVNLDSSEEVVIEKDVNARNSITKEVDKEKATRDITDSSRDERVVLVKAEQGEQPIVLKTLKPRVRGVLVVAKGAENMKVKALITDAVQKVLHVEPHKISILPKKG